MHSTYNTAEGGGIPTYLHCIKSTIGQSSGSDASVSEHSILEN